MSTTITESSRTTTETVAAPRSFPTVLYLQPLSGGLAEHLLELSTGTPDDVDAGDDMDDYQGYECFAPQALIVVDLEPAATSPFMDA